MKSTELIKPTAIQTPIAVSGDKVIPNQTATTIDTSSIEAGFLPITSTPLDSGGEAPERTDFNGMFYLATDQRVFLQNGGIITYDANVVSKIGGYPKDAILGYLTSNGFGFVRSLIEDNAYNFVETPSYINNQYWEYINFLNFTLLDTNFTNINNSINDLSNSAVKLTGDQTVAGVKTFSSSPIVPTPASTDNSTKSASTAFVKSVLSSSGNGFATYSKATNGYIKFANGIIIQWGISGTRSSLGTVSVTLPTAFSNTNYAITTFMGAGTVDNSTSNSQQLSSRATSSFMFYQHTSAAIPVLWMAIGY